MQKSSTGLDEHVAALLCYLVGWISGLVFFLIEKENESVRFHAAQSIVTFGGLTVASIVFPAVPLLGNVFGPAVAAVGFVLWLLLMIKAFQGGMWRLPVAADLADRLLQR